VISVPIPVTRYGRSAQLLPITSPVVVNLSLLHLTSLQSWVITTTTQLLPVGHSHEGVIVVKGLQVLDVLERFPSVVAHGPSNIKFDGPPDKPMANNLINHPFVVRHPKIVEAFAFTTQED